MNYWIILNGVKLGPLPYDDIVRLASRPDVPVWREGLDNWYSVSTLPEFSALFTAPHYAMPSVPESPVTAYGAMGSMDPSYQRPYVTNEKQPMPPTYLAWSIVVMLLCCLIPGIVALIYSTKVSSAFSSGDYEGARSASNTAAMWVIISVVCGLVWIPFQFVLFFI